MINIIPEYSGFSTRRINMLSKERNYLITNKIAFHCISFFVVILVLLGHLYHFYAFAYWSSNCYRQWCFATAFSIDWCLLSVFASGTSPLPTMHHMGKKHWWKCNVNISLSNLQISIIPICSTEHIFNCFQTELISLPGNVNLCPSEPILLWWHFLNVCWYLQHPTMRDVICWSFSNVSTWCHLRL